MIKRFLVMGLFLMGFGVAWGNDDNRPIQPAAQSPIFIPRDAGFRVTFSTTIPKDTATVILGTHTAQNFAVPSGITFSTGAVTAAFTSTTTTTFGGRLHFAFQVVSSTGKLHVNIGRDASTSSPYYEQKDWVILDDPIAIQEQISVYAVDDEAVIYGWFWTHKRGVNGATHP